MATRKSSCSAGTIGSLDLSTSLALGGRGRAKERSAVEGPERRRPGLFSCCLFATLLASFCVTSASAVSRASARFNIRAQQLADALDRFGEQSGLQIVYEQPALEGRSAPDVVGTMQADAALELLLRGSGLVWAFVNDQTVVVQKAAHPVADPLETATPASNVTATTPIRSQIAALSVIRVNEDPRRVLPNVYSSSTYGFAMPLLETPRSISFISEETIDLFGLSAVEDLVRVVPGVFTTTRFGIQGAVDIRNVPADTYFRGMKRLSLQGNGRSVLAAMDTIEVIGGPPSPLYGMGKIGGYTNLVPKSGRAASGAYLTDMQGFVQGIVGNYSRSEGSFGIGGPMNLLDRFGKHGGYYVYGLVEDSHAYAAGVPIKQQVLQAATSVDDFLGPFRLETGASYQVSQTSGALTGRFTQDLVDTGRYIRGTPLVNLDANDNGAIGYLELVRGSPVKGNMSSNNQPLIQTWNWPTDAQGKPLPLDQFPKIKGIPQTLYTYLVAHPEADPTGLLRAQGVGGPLPTSGQVPIGMVLDPRTVGYDTLNLRRAGAFEKDIKARFATAFLDLIDDDNPNLTLRNQLFFDSMDQYKNSNQPYVQEQDVYVIEDKFTATWRLPQLTPWMNVNALITANARNTVSEGKTSGPSDFSSHRTDAMASTWLNRTGGMTPNTTFASPLDNTDLATDGVPWVSLYRTSYSELGVGLMFDVELWRKNRLMIGGRFDGSDGKNIDYAGSFNSTVGTPANPGLYSTADAVAKKWDSQASWSVSLSRELPHNIWPYVTWGTSSIVLDANNNQLVNAVINGEGGHIGTAEMREVGVKASWFDRRLFIAGSAYDQARTEVESDDDSALTQVYATATRTRGWGVEMKYVPIRSLFLSLYTLRQVTRFAPNIGSSQLVDARTLGFQDVLDASGNVIYPAEAFLYGGRARINLPNGLPQYSQKQGNPEYQSGFSASYQWSSGLGVTLGGNYFSSTCTGRLCIVELPSTSVFNGGLFYDIGRWSLKLDATNLSNERYFRARTGDTLGNVLAQAMPDRRWQVTVKAKF